MNPKFKKVFCITVGIIIYSLIIFITYSRHKMGDIKDISDIKQKIVFIQQYINYSDGYVNRGYFIDNKGNKVLYDLTLEDKKYNDIKEVLSYLDNFQYNTSELTIDQTDLLKYYKLLYKINPYYRIKEKPGGFDMGSDTLYGLRYDLDNSVKIVLIDAYGDTMQTNTDNNAVKIKEGLRKLMCK